MIFLEALELYQTTNTVFLTDMSRQYVSENGSTTSYYERKLFQSIIICLEQIGKIWVMYKYMNKSKT